MFMQKLGTFASTETTLTLHQKEEDEGRKRITLTPK